MGWQFRKSKTIGRTLRVTASKKGLGASVGIPGLRIGVGADGKVRRTVSIPGTGLRKTEVLSKSGKGSGLPHVCPDCGKKVAGADSYCRYCGCKL